MDLKELKQVVDLMKRSDLIEFEIEEENLKLRIKRDSQTAGLPLQAVAPQPPAPAQAQSSPAAPAAAAAQVVEPGIEVVKSPMVGTFYRAPNPDSPVFIDVGGSVTPESVVCIIEAMKVMNEIQAEVSGTVTEVLVENGQSVEYGQPLFKVKKR
jgi:acetyl-CoA carboxylase biotin carboxyl carrier protein